ncbi:MAG: hypothetical protein H6586_01565 [Flavobacteriales bacterium]|nr:hypothetical protein [Flavobacteriales bacterium]
MKNLLATLIVLLITQTGFGQDSIPKIKLKPINILDELRKKENIELEKERLNDSLNNSATCKESWVEYYKLLKKNDEELKKIKKKVSEMNNNNHTGYYYFVVRKCNSEKFDFKGCGNFILLKRCTDYEYSINKQEKSTLLLDGPSGGVFYFDDLNIHKPKIPLGVPSKEM